MGRGVSAPEEKTRTVVPAEEALAAIALIRAYTARDIYTAERILARWAYGRSAGSFAATVATSAAVILTREAAGDRDGALRAADAALEVYQGLTVKALVA